MKVRRSSRGGEEANRQEEGMKVGSEGKMEGGADERRVDNIQ